jgi:DNA polymerase III subunit beta
MELRVERDAFADAVTWTARSLPARPPMQVLLGLLLDASGPDGLEVSGFDYEVSSRVGLDSSSGLVGVGDPGRVLVPGRLLADIVRALPPAPVDLRLDGSRVVLTCGAARFTLPTLPVEDYPALPAMPETAGALESDVFAAAVAQVAIAAGRDDTLPVLTGVRVEIDDDTLTLAATDRYRLAVRTLPWSPAAPGLSTTALVPARTLAETAKALTGGPEVTLALSTPGGGGSEGMIGFEGGGRRTTSRLLEGEFPKYRSLLPSESAATAQVPTTAFGEAVRRVALVAARNAPVRLTFTADGLVLEAGGADDASASEQLDCAWEGQDEPFSIAFNPGYLLDGLSAVDSDLTVLSFTGPTRPAVLTSKHDGEGDEGTASARDYRYLLMPVRLSG